MAKVALFVALAACLLAAAFSHKTIITTTTIHDHDDNGFFPAPDGLPTTTNGFFPAPDGLPTTTNGFFPAPDGLPTTTNGFPFPDALPTGGAKQYCQVEVQQQLNHCQMHLAQGQGQGQEQEHLQLCCDQLKQVRPEQCQCEAIQKVVQQAAQQFQQRQGGGGGGRRAGGQGQGQGQQIQVQEILRKAQMLPQQCNLQVEQCPIRLPSASSWF